MGELGRRYPLPDLAFSRPHVIPGIFADINYISGTVHFDDVTSIGSRFVECALKVLRVSPTDRNQMEQMENVLTIFSEHLSTKNAAYSHPNISPMTVVNVTRIAESNITFKAILSPWYPRGSILEHVNAHPGVDRTTLIIEIGKALKHLHSHDVVHGAIQPLNILIDNDGHVVVTDTGLHTLMSQYMFFPLGRLPVPPSVMYQPSDRLFPVTDIMVRPTASMDVYSFAVTAWTIFAGKEPFSNLPNFRTVAQIVVEIGLHGHRRLVKPSNTSIGLWIILRKCLAMDPALRPTMMEIVAELESLSLS